MKKEDLRAALAAAGLDRLIPHLDQLTLPAIRIEANLLADDDLPVGASKLGGRPDLPPTLDWPSNQGKPLSFLAQFNLSEIHRYDIDHALPAAGMLSFFFDFETDPYGLYPHDRPGWRVLYFEGELSALARKSWPATLAHVYRLSASEPWFSTNTTMSNEPDWIIGVTTSDDERLKLSRLVDSAVIADAGVSKDDDFNVWGTRSQLLGYPWIGLVRGMPIACELVANRQLAQHIEVLAPAERGEEWAQYEMREAYKNWQLLLQLGNISGIPGDDDLDDDDPFWKLGMWGRGGVMYFWIERDRLAERDFSNVWLLGSAQV